MQGSQTRLQILDAAEQLFADLGYAAASMRAITRMANVNLAAVNYHFGSKEQLLCAIVARRFTPVNRARLQLLDQYEATAGPQPTPLRKILYAYISPLFSLTSEAFLRLIGRLYSEPVDSLVELYEELFGHLLLRFRKALATTLPELPRRELYWRLEFVVGMQVHTLMAGNRLKLVTEGLCDVSDTDGLTERMVSFAEAGMRAPLPATLHDAQLADARTRVVHGDEGN